MEVGQRGLLESCLQGAYGVFGGECAKLCICRKRMVQKNKDRIEWELAVIST